MTRKYRVWSLEAKRAAVDRMGCCTHGQLAAELGISKRQLYSWRDHFVAWSRGRSGRAAGSVRWSEKTGS